MTQNNIIQLPTKETILAELEGLINECEKLEKLEQEIQDLKARNKASAEIIPFNTRE
jgi:hypothetical protein